MNELDFLGPVRVFLSRYVCILLIQLKREKIGDLV